MRNHNDLPYALSIFLFNKTHRMTMSGWGCMTCLSFPTKSTDRLPRLDIAVLPWTVLLDDM